MLYRIRCFLFGCTLQVIDTTTTTETEQCIYCSKKVVTDICIKQGHDWRYQVKPGKNVRVCERCNLRHQQKVELVTCDECHSFGSDDPWPYGYGDIPTSTCSICGGSGKVESDWERYIEDASEHNLSESAPSEDIRQQS